jgi:hypothetical protein
VTKVDRVLLWRLAMGVLVIYSAGADGMSLDSSRTGEILTQGQQYLRRARLRGYDRTR